MNTEAFEENIFDMIREQQAKLGYRSEPVTFYYMHSSLNRMLETDLKPDEFRTALESFMKDFSKRYGKIEIKSEGSRLSVTVSSDVSDHVHENMKSGDFIVRFVALIRKHGVTIDDIRSLFKEYSKNVHFEKTDNGEFDYLMYFEDGNPDSYRYCISDEQVHFTYHRYTPSDYEDFGF